jgi:multiple sugar transport system substrate-binding protein
MTARKAICLLSLLMLAGCNERTTPLELQVFADPLEARAYRELVDAFERAHPDERVHLTTIGKQKDHMAKLSTRFAGGNPPDLFLLNFRRYGQFAARGVLTPLGPRLAASGAFDPADFYGPAVEAFAYDGVQQCLPQNVSSLVVYLNRELFTRFEVPLPAADWNWQDFADTARRLTRSTAGDGHPEIYGLGFDPVFIRLLPFVWQAGGDVVDDLHHPTRLRLDELRALMGIAFVKQWVLRDRVVPPRAEHRAENPEARFARGALGMLLHSRRYTATLRGLGATAPDWDVAPLPVGGQAATILHADAYCMAAASQNPDAAQRFVAFALSAEGQTILARSGRIVPSRRSVAESRAFLDPDQAPQSAQVFLDSVDHLRRTPNIAAWNEIETRLDPIVEEWFFEPPPPSLEDPAVDAMRLVSQLRAAAQPLLEQSPP